MRRDGPAGLDIPIPSRFDGMLDPARLDFGAREDLLLTVLEKLIAIAPEAADDETRG